MKAKKLNMSNPLTRETVEHYLTKPTEEHGLTWFMIRGVGYVVCKKEHLEKFGIEIDAPAS